MLQDITIVILIEFRLFIIPAIYLKKNMILIFLKILQIRNNPNYSEEESKLFFLGKCVSSFFCFLESLNG